MQKRKRNWLLLALGVLLMVIGLTMPPLAFVGDELVVLEVVKTPEQHARGLSQRETIPKNYGMLFVFPDDGEYAFWMKDMLVPIDMFWLTKSGKVVHVERGVAPDTFPSSFVNDTPARYVLETRSGVAAIHSIEDGSMIRFVSLPPWSGIVPTFFVPKN